MTHTITELKAVSNEELNRMVAKLCGYPRPYDFYIKPVPKEILFDVPNDAQPIPDFRTERVPVPRFVTDIRAAYELEESVPERVIGEYECALIDVIKDGGVAATVFRVAHATPRQRCIAYVLTMEGMK